MMGAVAGPEGWSPALLAAAVGLLGLLVGSFLNVCIHRLPRGESLLWPASHCPACRRSLAWFENVPVVSWLLLRGRCRSCRQPVAGRYPAVELVTAALWALTAWVVGVEWLLLPRLLLVSALVVLFVIDLEHQLLPDAVTLPGIAAGLLVSGWLPPQAWVWLPGDWRLLQGPLDAALGMLLGGGVLWGVSEAYYRLRGQEGLGFGDVKMLAMIGAFLGWQQVLVTLFLASLAGSVVGVGLIATGRVGMQSKLPFGTFLALGALAAALAGTPLWRWYVGFYG